MKEPKDTSKKRKDSSHGRLSLEPPQKRQKQTTRQKHENGSVHTTKSSKQATTPNKPSRNESTPKKKTSRSSQDASANANFTPGKKKPSNYTKQRTPQRSGNAKTSTANAPGRRESSKSTQSQRSAAVPKRKKSVSCNLTQSVLPNPPQSWYTGLHQCKFLNPNLPGLTALAVSPDETYLAAARTDHSIVYAVKESDEWLPVTEVSPNSVNAELEVSSLKFSPCGKYLFIARFDGDITIYSVSEHDGLVFHMNYTPGGGALWDIQFNPYQPKLSTSKGFFQLAIACNDGTVRILTPDENFMSTDGELSKDPAHYILETSSQAPGRILCVTWAEPSTAQQETKGEFVLVCGDSEGSIRWIDAKTCRLKGDAKIAPGNDGNPNSIWTIQCIFNGNTVVCADDRGYLTIWDSSTETMNSEVQLERLDCQIWCSAVLKPSPYATHVTIVFGGADGSLTGLNFDKETQLHSIIRPRRIHTHDIRAIVPFSAPKEQGFFTASIDTRILSLSVDVLTSGMKFEQEESKSTISIHFGIVGRPPLTQVVRQHNLLVSTSKNKGLEFWSLQPRGYHKKTSANRSSQLPKFKLKMTLDNRRVNIQAFSMSPDARYIAVSDLGMFRLYSLQGSAPEPGILSSAFGEVKLKRIPTIAEESLYGCTDLSFCGDYIVAISRDENALILFNFVLGKSKTIYLDKDLRSTASRLNRVLCTDAGFIVATDSRNQLFVAKLDLNSDDIRLSQRWKNISIPSDPKLVGRPSPSRRSVITSISADRDSDFVLIGTSDNRVVFFALRNIHSNKSEKPEEDVCISFSIGFVPTCLTIGKSGNCLVTGTTNVCIVSFDIQEPSEDLTRAAGDGIPKMKRQKEQLETHEPPTLFSLTKSKRALWSSGVLSSGDVVLVQKEMEVIQSALPDVIPKKVY